MGKRNVRGQGKVTNWTRAAGYEEKDWVVVKCVASECC